MQRFTHSSDVEPKAVHVPRDGSLAVAPEVTIKAVEEFAVQRANAVWQRMQEADDPLPLGHDGYLKLWALSDPEIAADFILLDEGARHQPGCA